MSRGSRIADERDPEGSFEEETGGVAGNEVRKAIYGLLWACSFSF